jgi:hypothetical protein
MVFFHIFALEKNLHSMNQKEAIIRALQMLGGRAPLKEIYRFAYPLADWSGSQKWENTLRWYLQKGTESFRSPKRGWWELVSYQEEIAVRDKEIAELRAEVERLKKIPTEDDFVNRLIEKLTTTWRDDKKTIAEFRKILDAMGRADVVKELDASLKGKVKKSKTNEQNANPNIVVNGDYVVDKHVENEVNGVASGATGINVRKNKE